MDTPARKRRALRRSAGESVSRWKSRLLDAAILVATGLVCLFVFSLSTRLGYSRSEKAEPPIIVRTQVLNACGRAGLASRTSEHMSQLAVGRMRFDVVDVGNFNRTDIRRSFVVNHRLSDQQVRAVVGALNIGPVDIVDADQKVSDLGLDLTVVLGSSATESEVSE